MPSQIFPFTAPINYTYDSNKIDITGGKAQLKLQDNASQQFTEDFADDTDFTYDSDFSEFSGGILQQKDTQPEYATFYASYGTDEDADWSSGDGSGTLVGGATVSGGELDLSHNDVRYAEYDAVGNADSAQTGCIRMRVKPNYSGSPASSVCYFVITKEDASVINIIQMQHVASGQIHFFIYDQTGSPIYQANHGAWSPTAGTTYEFELNYHFGAGQTRLFIDGTQFGSTITGTRSSDINLLRIGSDYMGATVSNFSILDVLIFSYPQHTSNYTPDWTTVYDSIYRADKVEFPQFSYSGAGAIQAFTNIAATIVGTVTFIINDLWWNGASWTASDGTVSESNTLAEVLTNIATLTVSDTVNVDMWTTNSNTQATIDNFILTYTGQIYFTTNPTVEMNTRWYIDDLEAFTEVATKAGSDQIKYILKQGDTWYYHDGSDWTESDGTYSQANTAAEIETYKADFTDAKVYLGIKLFLHSDDGTTTPSIDTLTVQYSYAGEAPDAIETCLVWGTKLDYEGNADLDPFYVKAINSFIQYKDYTLMEDNRIVVTPDSTGYWEIELVENENMVGNQGYEFIFNKRNIQYKVVPNETTKAYNDLEDWTEE